jgi:hypothetical protein
MLSVICYAIYCHEAETGSSRILKQCGNLEKCKSYPSATFGSSIFNKHSSTLRSTELMCFLFVYKNYFWRLIYKECTLKSIFLLAAWWRLFKRTKKKYKVHLDRMTPKKVFGSILQMAFWTKVLLPTVLGIWIRKDWAPLAGSGCREKMGKFIF